MISWLISQQVVLSCALIFLILTERFIGKYIGARTRYFVWALLPLTLIIHNLPQQMLSVPDNQIVNYLVLFGQKANTIDWSLNWILIWFSGLFCLICYFISSQFRLHRKIYKPHQLALPVYIPKVVKVYTCKDIEGPMLYGVISPKLLLPLHFNVAFELAEQSLMLQHELVHYQRKDNWFNLLALILLAVFWFNPLIWLSHVAFRRSQELACDATVLHGATTQQKISYGKALVRCAENAVREFAIYSPYGEKHTMMTRLKLINSSPKNHPFAIALILVVSIGLLSNVALAKFTHNSESIDDGIPITRTDPIYPSDAADQGLEGSVILQFDIEKDGSTSNIRVISADPAYIFDKSAISALTNWEYKPRILSGQAYKQTGLKVQLDFKLTK